MFVTKGQRPLPSFPAPRSQLRESRLCAGASRRRVLGFVVVLCCVLLCVDMAPTEKLLTSNGNLPNPVGALALVRDRASVPCVLRAPRKLKMRYDECDSSPIFKPPHHLIFE